MINLTGRKQMSRGSRRKNLGMTRDGCGTRNGIQWCGTKGPFWKGYLEVWIVHRGLVY